MLNLTLLKVVVAVAAFMLTMYIPGAFGNVAFGEVGVIRLCTQDRCYYPDRESLARQTRILELMIKSYNSMLGLLGLLWVLIILNPALDDFHFGVFVPISMSC